jgi:hypothetical protein
MIMTMSPEYARRVRQNAYKRVHRFRGALADNMSNRDILQEAIKSLEISTLKTEEERQNLREYKQLLAQTEY